MKVSPSLIAADLADMKTVVTALDQSVVDLLHCDVMDGHFVPNMTFGAGYVKALQSHTDIPLDVHLMIEEPERSIEQWIALNPWCITIHYESTRFPARLLRLIKEGNSLPALAINPATPVESVLDILPYAEMVLVMSVDPGFYGQSFMPEALTRIARLRKEYKGLIQVDGGISTKNIGDVAAAGADIVVAGSAAFKGGDVHGNVQALKQAAGKK